MRSLACLAALAAGSCCPDIDTATALGAYPMQEGCAHGGVVLTLTAADPAIAGADTFAWEVFDLADGSLVGSAAASFVSSEQSLPTNALLLFDDFDREVRVEVTALSGDTVVAAGEGAGPVRSEDDPGQITVLLVAP